MIAYLSGVVAAGPLGRSYVKLRNGPLGRLAVSSIFDWVIPGALVATIVIGMAWVAFAGH